MHCMIAASREMSDEPVLLLSSKSSLDFEHLEHEATVNNATKQDIDSIIKNRKTRLFFLNFLKKPQHTAMLLTFCAISYLTLITNNL